MKLSDLHLCLVTDFPNYLAFATYKSFIIEIAAAGISAVQLRAKNASAPELTAMALDLKAWLAPFDVPLIINDSVEVARLVDADGIHLGQSDSDPAAARTILGSNKWIGLSVENEQELAQANQLTCINYVAASAIFPTLSKTNCRHYWGLDGLRQFVAKSVHPVVAIGGINLTNIDTVMACGAHGVAVIGALHQATRPAHVVSTFLKSIRGQIHV